MKFRILIFLTIIFSFIGYLEWGSNNHTFLITAEADIIYKILTNPSSVIHPFILIPLFGQLLLCYLLFKTTSNKIILYIALSCISVLFLFILFIGVISLNFKIILSVLPFFGLSYLLIKYVRIK
jgi:hypothetical protein